ncbi:hypothetical protein IPJ72_03250 [Candidatus Peregrinibacteria bacterium]|nr:MAG: hypothetical protein IPJ72_03250 [Candidatus Peregrinibacteria bacterium]
MFEYKKNGLNWTFIFLMIIVVLILLISLSIHFFRSGGLGGLGTSGPQKPTVDFLTPQQKNPESRSVSSGDPR